MQNDFGAGALGAVVGAIITGLFAWLAQRTRGDSDQEVAVLAEWSKLYTGVTDRLAAVEKEFAEYRQQVAREMDEMREKCRRENEEMRAKHRREMRTMRELNEGLQRMIAQNSQSTAHLMGGSPVTNARDGDNED